MRSADLRDACQGWVIAASRFCAERRGFSQGHFHIDFGSGVHLLRETETLDYRFLLRSEAVELGSLRETTAVLHVIQGDPIICAAIFGQAPWPPPGETWPEGFGEFGLGSHWLSALLAQYFAQCDYINRPDKTAIDQAAFDYSYGQFEPFIFEPETIPVSWLYQFRNLKTAVESTDLSDGVRIRRPSSSEQGQAKRSRLELALEDGARLFEMFSSPAARMEKLDLDNVPEVFLEISGTRGTVTGELAEAHAQKLLLALRLIHDRPVAIHSGWHIDTNPFPGIVPPRYVRPETMPLAKPEEPYVITPELAAQVVDIWPELELPQAGSRLEVAVGRFDDSYYRKRAEDQLIDYWIALEAVFLPESFVREMADMAAEIIAHYLGTTESERTSIATLIRASHNTRSRIVHGKPVRDTQFEATVGKTGSLLRRGLLKRLRED